MSREDTQEKSGPKAERIDQIAAMEALVYPRSVKTPARLLGIYVAAQAAELPHAVERVRALPGQGLDGDRYAADGGTFSGNSGKRDVTLIEAEALHAYESESGKKLSAAESRRNLLTEGVRLNDLVGREFQVGAVRLLGLRLSEPCTHLARLTHPETLPGLVHRGGLVAEILTDGELRVGDEILESQK
ncbi:MAG: MOSC domain-containing protein [Chthoniobacterales bacterium]